MSTKLCNKIKKDSGDNFKPDYNEDQNLFISVSKKGWMDRFNACEYLRHLNVNRCVALEDQANCFKSTEHDEIVKEKDIGMRSSGYLVV